MDWIINVIWLFLIGIPGWLLLAKLKVPTPSLMGAIVSAGLFSILGWAPSCAPAGLKLLLQIVLGLFIGLKVTRESGRVFRSIAPLALLAAVWWLALPLGMGWLLSTFFGMDLATALLGTVPGGIAEMSLMALTLGADAAVVALMQFFRLGGILIGLPPLAAWLSKTFEGQGQPSASDVAPPANRLPGTQHDLLPFVLGLAIATCGALLGAWLELPSGGFVGALVLTGLASFFGVPLRGLPGPSRDFALLGLGSTIGLTLDAETLSALGPILLPVMAITCVMIGWGLILSIFVRRTMGWDLMTCFLASSPGGVTALSAASADLGADPLQVSLLHLVRLFTVFLLLPPLLVRLAG